MIKKILKYSSITAVFLFIILVAVISYLILSADMLQPDIGIIKDKYTLIKDGNYRQWGNNYLHKSNSGLWEMKISGSDFECGEAIGKLSEDLLYYQEKVFVDQIKQIIPSENYLRFLGYFTLLFNRNLAENIPEEYRREIYGISLSCSHEFDYIATPYERQLNYHAAHDLGHALQDYMLVGCSSFATWGDASADSTLIIGRNFDFFVGDDFARNKVVLFYQPNTGYKFASVAWAGMTGVLSGMNEKGLTVTINAAKSAVPTSAKTPISVLTREILQYASTINEAYQIALKRQTFVAESILIGSAKDGCAAIIEKSPEKTALYRVDGDYIICTNHFQSGTFANDERNIENIATTDSKYRYERVEELLQQNIPLDEKKATSILRNRMGKGGKEIGLTNEKAINQFIAHHSVIFKPQELVMWVSTSPWQSGAYMAYDLRKIFSDSIDLKGEIFTSDLTIPQDTFISSPVYSDLIDYKRLTKFIQNKIRNKESLPADSLTKYENSNPEFYYTYELLGDYYKSLNDNSMASSYWSNALTKEIPRENEKERIKQKMKNTK